MRFQDEDINCLVLHSYVNFKAMKSVSIGYWAVCCLIIDLQGKT